MLKFGLRLLFGIFTQLIAVIISYEFFFEYSKNNGGVGGTPISNIHPLIWIIIVLEIIISFYILSISNKNKIQ